MFVRLGKHLFAPLLKKRESEVKKPEAKKQNKKFQIYRPSLN